MYRQLICIVVSFVICFSAKGQNIETVLQNELDDVIRVSGTNLRVSLKKGDVKTAIALHKNKKYFILYNPDFFKSIQSRIENSGLAFRIILAHEYAHHLHGHSYKYKQLSPGDELSADRHAGFLMAQNGEKLEEVIAVVSKLDEMLENKEHPMLDARIKALTIGWNHATNQEIQKFTLDELNITLRCQFNDDSHNYYIDEGFQVLWLDLYNNPIVIGRVENSQKKGFLYDYWYRDSKFVIDYKGNLLNEVVNGSMITIGSVYKINEDE